MIRKVIFMKWFGLLPSSQKAKFFRKNKIGPRCAGFHDGGFKHEIFKVLQLDKFLFLKSRAERPYQSKKDFNLHPGPKSK